MSEFSKGDLIEATKGEDCHRGRAEARGDGLLGLGKKGYMLHWYEREGFTLTLIEKAAPPLPTEFGLYLSSKEGGPWVFRLDVAGYWTLLNTNSLFPIGDGHLECHAPFTRLEPVADTAKKVLDRVAAFWEFGPPRSIVAELKQIGDEFGVQS